MGGRGGDWGGGGVLGVGMAAGSDRIGVGIVAGEKQWQEKLPGKNLIIARRATSAATLRV